MIISHFEGGFPVRIPAKRDTFWRDCTLFMGAVILSIVVAWVLVGAILETLSGT